MIRTFEEKDLDRAAEIWLKMNQQAHAFIPASYWEENYEMVKKMLPEAEILIAEDGGVILGFLGMQGDYIAGIFVDSSCQSRGIGKQLLDEAKRRRSCLTLHVYEKNERAVRFYEREHFRTAGIQMDEAVGERELLMKWV